MKSIFELAISVLCLEMLSKRKQIFSTMGPGILLALSATGTSHLVQSTRAGAYFGLGLLLFIVAANVFKYPFIEFGTRYASATGKSILEGYKDKSKLMLWVYLMVNLATMFTVNAAVTFVTAGLLSNFLGVDLPIYLVAAAIFLICFLILALGKYRLLDSSLKIVGLVLVITTITSCFVAFYHGPLHTAINFELPEFSKSNIFFIIALMGWMPTAIELSPWNSIWTLERIKQTGYRPSLRQSLFDFNFGYWSSATLAVLFMLLGAYMWYGSGADLPDSSVGFSKALIQIYTENLGGWSYWLIAMAAFSAMFSTGITVLDGFSRSTQAALVLLFEKKKFLESHNSFMGTMLFTASGAFLLITFFINSFSALIDLATTVSFLAAPVMAALNFAVVSDKNFPKHAQPKKWMRILSYLALLFLISFSLTFIYISF